MSPDVQRQANIPKFANKISRSVSFSSIGGLRGPYPLVLWLARARENVIALLYRYYGPRRHFAILTSVSVPVNTGESECRLAGKYVENVLK
jgi:hypothetical protein